MQTPKPKPSIRTIAEKLSSMLYMDSTSYRFKTEKSAYDEGVLKAIDWMQDLCLHYIEEDNRLKRELLEVLRKNLEKIDNLKPTPKTQAMRDTIERALDYVKNTLEVSDNFTLHIRSTL